MPQQNSITDIGIKVTNSEEEVEPPKGHIYLDMRVLCSMVRPELTSVTATEVLYNRGQNAFYLHGLLPQLARNYQVYLIVKNSIPDELWANTQMLIYAENMLCDNKVEIWQGVDFNNLPKFIEVALSQTFPENLRTDRYLYVDTINARNMKETVLRHRKLGILNAGMIVDGGMGLSNQDVNKLIAFGFFTPEYWTSFVNAKPGELLNQVP